MSTVIIKERGRVVAGGMGCFLCPPNHPEHSYSVETDLNQRKANRGSMSLSFAADCEWLTDETRFTVSELLNSWQKLPLDSAVVQDWIAKVLGYYKDCYRNLDEQEPKCWHADNLKITKMPAKAGLTTNDHAGVHLIRQYYPEFSPTKENFRQAYWGTKK